MGISAGLLNERIRVLKEIHVVSEYGDQDIQYKEKFWCRARHLDKEGTRTEVNNEIFYTNDKRFEIRIYQDIKDTDIIQFYDQFYRIINISPDRPNQRKIITVELINSFDFPIDQGYESSTPDTPDVPDPDVPDPSTDPGPEPDPDSEPGLTFVYNGLEFYINNDMNTVTLVAANADNRFPELDYSGDIVIPSQVVYKDMTFTVNHISFNVFYNTEVTNIVIPNTVISINANVLTPPSDPYTKVPYQFENTYSLQTITILTNREPGILVSRSMFGALPPLPKSSVQKIYVLPELVDRYKEVMDDMGGPTVHVDLSYLIYPIEN